MEEIDKVNLELETQRNKLDDCIENFKYLLDHQNIRDINILSFYKEISNILTNIDYLENRKFNLEFWTIRSVKQYDGNN